MTSILDSMKADLDSKNERDAWIFLSDLILRKKNIPCDQDIHLFSNIDTEDELYVIFLFELRNALPNYPFSEENKEALLEMISDMDEYLKISKDIKKIEQEIASLEQKHTDTGVKKKQTEIVSNKIENSVVRTLVLFVLAVGLALSCSVCPPFAALVLGGIAAVLFAGSIGFGFRAYILDRKCPDMSSINNSLNQINQDINQYKNRLILKQNEAQNHQVKAVNVFSARLSPDSLSQNKNIDMHSHYESPQRGHGPV